MSQAYQNNRDMEKREEGWGLRFRVVTLIGGRGGCTTKRVEMPISVNTGGRTEVTLT